MEQSTLAEILGVEQEIRAQLDAEREQASRWLENTRREIEQAHQAEVARLQDEARQRRETALRDARDKASALIQAAEAAASVQARGSDDELRPIVRARIAVIVPEAVR
jgi:hypothetical protein